MEDLGRFVLDFGKYRGKTLDQVAGDDEGLLYLDWLVGETNKLRVKSVLQKYLRDPDLQRRLGVLTDD